MLSRDLVARQWSSSHLPVGCLGSLHCLCSDFGHESIRRLHQRPIPRINNLLLVALIVAAIAATAAGATEQTVRKARAVKLQALCSLAAAPRRGRPVGGSHAAACRFRCRWPAALYSLVLEVGPEIKHRIKYFRQLGRPQRRPWQGHACIGVEWSACQYRYPLG